MALVLSGGTVVASLDPPAVTTADVVVADGRVASVGRAASPDAEVLDCAGCLVFPGNVCAHHHLYSALARGMPYRLEPPTDFVQILRRVWWRLDRALTETDNRVSAQVGAVDALLAGTTTIVDHHASPEAIDGQLEVMGGALADAGVRAVECYEVTDRDGAERAAAGIEENRRAAGKDAFPTVRAMVGAHASFTLSDETLAACAGLAHDLGVGIHVHVAEDEADERDSLARSGKRVVERLAEAEALDERALLAHCVHVDEREIGLIRDAGAWVAHNARSNMNNRVGHAPVRALGDRVALGTDGIDGDMFAESKAAYWRAHEADPEISPAWALDRLAAGARFAGRVFDEPLLGRIEPGAPADLLVLAYDPPTPIAPENLAGHWIFGLSAANVRDVVVAGEVVVRDRGPTRLDEADLRARARERAEALWRRIDEIPEHPFEPRGARG